jgi:hypothetical protein
MSDKFKLKTKQDGIVLSKFEKEATNEFTNAEGKLVAAAPKRFIVKIAAGAGWTDEGGYEDVVVAEYKVSEEFYKKVKYLTPIIAELEFSNYGVKPISLGLKK